MRSPTNKANVCENHSHNQLGHPPPLDKNFISSSSSPTEAGTTLKWEFADVSAEPRPVSRVPRRFG